MSPLGVEFLHGPSRNFYTSFRAKGPVKFDFLRNPEQSQWRKTVPKTLLHGTAVAMYIVGQERRLVDPPSQVVAGVRTVTTKNEWARRTPTLSRPFALLD